MVTAWSRVAGNQRDEVELTRAGWGEEGLHGGWEFLREEPGRMLMFALDFLTKPRKASVGTLHVHAVGHLVFPTAARAGL